MAEYDVSDDLVLFEGPPVGGTNFLETEFGDVWASIPTEGKFFVDISGSLKTTLTLAGQGK